MATLETAEKDWRPEGWERIRMELASTPYAWSPSGGGIGHTEQIVEATASKILEEWKAAIDAMANHNWQKSGEDNGRFDF